MEHRFEDAAQYAQTFDDPARDASQMPERVIEALGIPPGKAVGDIGAGTGYFTVGLAETPLASTMFSVGFELSMVDYVTIRAEAAWLDNIVTLLSGSDRTNLPEPVDLLLIVDACHHLPDRVAYFTRLREDLRPSGRLGIIDFSKDSPSGRLSSSGSRRSRSPAIWNAPVSRSSSSTASCRARCSSRARPLETASFGSNLLARSNP